MEEALQGQRSFIPSETLQPRTNNILFFSTRVISNFYERFREPAALIATIGFGDWAVKVSNASSASY